MSLQSGILSFFDVLLYCIAVVKALYVYLGGLVSEWIRGRLFRILRRSSIPTHLAVVMDGNRRFAVKSGLLRKADGHQYGFKKFEQVL